MDTPLSSTFNTAECQDGGIFDDCSGAIILTSNLSNCNYQYFSVDNALPDILSVQVPVCDHYEPAENILGAGVWFSFTAIENYHKIQINPVDLLDPVIEVYTNYNDNSDCLDMGDFFKLACKDDPGGFGGFTELTVYSLIPGYQYWIRIYDYGAYAPAAGSGGFGICLTHENQTNCDRESDSLALVEFYYAMNGENWQEISGWLEGPLETWDGIGIGSNGCIQCINLTNSMTECRIPSPIIGSSLVENFTGQLPDLNLPFLEIFDLRLRPGFDINFGEIPNFSYLRKLRYLAINGGIVEGAIPDFEHLPNLLLLTVYTGPFDEEYIKYPNFHHLKSLEELTLFGKFDNSRIPNFSGTPRLRRLDLIISPEIVSINPSTPKISDPIPDFSYIPFLYFFNTSTLHFEGNIPDFSNLPILRWLSITGSFTTPVELTNFSHLPNLRALSIKAKSISSQADYTFIGDIPNFELCPLIDFLAIDGVSTNGGSLPDLSHLNYLDVLRIRNCEIDQVIPTFIDNQSLVSIDFTNNWFNGDVPDLNLQDLASLSIEKNKFTFTNLLQSFSSLNSSLEDYTYEPQDSVGGTYIISKPPNSNYTINLNIDNGVISNAYYWYKDGNYLSTVIGNNTLSFEPLSLEDSGIYTCEITNPNIPDLTLYSRPVELLVEECGVSTQIIEWSCEPADTGVLIENYISSEGCDSIVALITTLLDSYTILINESTCDADEAGTELYELTTSQGCDSIITVITTLRDSYDLVLNQWSCLIAEVGAEVFNFTSIYDCDSTITVVTDLAEHYNITIITTSCDSNDVGTNVYDLTSSQGCDSIVTVNTALLNSYDITILETTCNPNNAGTEIHNLTTDTGCDSVITIITELLTSYDLTINQVACNQDEVGFEVLNFITVDGCDSTVTIETTLASSYNVLINIESCDSNDIGEIIHQFESSAGCDSIVTTITTLLYSYDISLTEVICDYESIVVGSQTFNAEGDYIIELATIEGCDSIIRLNLAVQSNTDGEVDFASLDQETICLLGSGIALSSLGSPPGGIFTGLGVDGNFFNPQIAGIGNHVLYYSYSYGDDCTEVDSIAVVVESCTGIGAMSSVTSLEIYPNPFITSTHLKYTLLSSARLKIELFDTRGKRYGILIDEIQPSGNYKYEISGYNLVPGVYELRISADEKILFRRIVSVR